MTAAGDSSTVEFRRSTRRQVVAQIVVLVIALLAAGTAAATFNLARGRQWWQGLWMLPLFLAGSLLSRLVRPPTPGYRSRLPMRLTDEHLEVTGPDDITLAIEWSNIARAEIRGRSAALVIEPVDPERTRPPLKRWQWAGYGQSRPYEILVPLAYMTPDRDVLRRELNRRLPASVVEPRA